MSETTLAAIPDLGYLLREYYELYRHMSSGGSDKIRAHQRGVRASAGAHLLGRTFPCIVLALVPHRD